MDTNDVTILIRFGNMWAQTWENAFKIVSPFPNVTNPLDEVNEALIKQVTARTARFVDEKISLLQDLMNVCSLLEID